MGKPPRVYGGDSGRPFREIFARVCVPANHLNVADVDDYRHFENREIKGSANAKPFITASRDTMVEGWFGNRVERSGFESFEEWAEKSQTTALIVLQRDTIIYERYFNGYKRGSYFHSQSMAKSFISFLIGAAIDDGYIAGVNDPATKYIPELKERDTAFAHITLKHLLQMRAGLKYNTGLFPGTYIHLPWHDEAVGYYHNNVRKHMIKEVDIERSPGKDFEYCNYNTSYLGLVIERATGKTVSAYLEEMLWSKIMEHNAMFSVDSKKNGFEYMPSRLMAKAIDYARFGQLFLNEGKWHREKIISAQWINTSTAEDTTFNRELYPEWFSNDYQNIYYGYHWWGYKNDNNTTMYAANGNLGQSIFIIPQKEMVIVHCGKSLAHFSEFDLWEIANNIELTDKTQRESELNEK